VTQAISFGSDRRLQLGVASNLNVTAKVNIGFKYFQEFANRSTFQGHSIQFSGSISF
jgi:hypothetical protein